MSKFWAVGAMGCNGRIMEAKPLRAAGIRIKEDYLLVHSVKSGIISFKMNGQTLTGKGNPTRYTRAGP